MNNQVKGLYVGIMKVFDKRTDQNLNHYSLFTFGPFNSDTDSTDDRDWQLYYFGIHPWDDDADGNLFRLYSLQEQIDKWGLK